MVDPGTAVGIISLGLQVLQGLAQYYTQFASFSAEITAVVRRIESLCVIIKALEGPVRRLERDEPISAAVRQCIEACKTGIRDLDTYQKQCGNNTFVPTAVADRMRLVKMRGLFPFRKSTLDGVGKTLERLQLNLMTINQALQLDTAILHNEGAKTQLAALNHSLEFVNHRQIYEIELLQKVDTASEYHKQQIDTSSSRIHHSMENINSQLWEFKREQESISRKVETLVQVIKHFPSSEPPPSILAKDACDKFLSLKIPIHNTRRDQNRLSRKFARLPSCSCPPIPPISRTIRPRWLPSIFWKNYLNHRTPCPLYAVSQKSLTIGLQFAVCNRVLQCIVETTFIRNNQSISAHITSYRTVGWDSPVYQLCRFLEARTSVYLRRKCSLKKVKREILFVQPLILELFREHRAHVRDIFPDGNTSFHQMCAIIDACERLGGFNQMEIREMLKDWVDHGVLVNHVGGPYEKTPLENLAGRNQGYMLRHNGMLVTQTMCTLMDLGGTYSVERIIKDSPYASGEELPELLRRIRLIEEEGDDIYFYTILHNIVQRSIKGLESSLRQIELLDRQVERRPVIQDLLNMLSAWPEGLRISLEAWEYTGILQRYGRGLLHRALIGHHMANVKILLDADCPIPDIEICWACIVCTEIEGIVNVFIRRLEPYKSGDSRTSNGDNLAEKTSYLYHVHGLTLRNAKLLFEAGFDNIDLCTSSGTPLWAQTDHLLDCDLGDESIWSNKMELIIWLIQNGASLENRHPSYNTTPSQVLAKSVPNLLFGTQGGKGNPKLAKQIRNKPEFYDLIQRCFTNTTEDHCNCACSSNGCNVMTLVIRHCFGYLGRTGPQLDDMAKAIFEWVDLDIKLEQQWTSTLLRSLTFERLNITHTCQMHCLYEHTFHSTQSEIPDIHFVEQADIKLLEILLSEFEHELSASPRSFWDFVSHDWKKRMIQVLEERSAPRAGEEEMARELGVLVHHGMEIERDLEDEEDPEWEDFKRTVTYYMNMPG